MIRWSNLINQFRLAPGTARYRIPLSLWQVGLMTASGVGGCLWSWWGALGGFVVAWLAHELFFMAFAERVVGLQELDYVYWRPSGYPKPCYVPTIERYYGPFISDAEAKR